MLHISQEFNLFASLLLAAAVLVTSYKAVKKK